MPINRIEQIVTHFGYGVEYDVTAVPISECLERRRAATDGAASPGDASVSPGKGSLSDPEITTLQ